MKNPTYRDLTVTVIVTGVEFIECAMAASKRRGSARSIAIKTMTMTTLSLEHAMRTPDSEYNQARAKENHG